MRAYLSELIWRRGKTPSILVVDDQPANIRLVNDVFKDDFKIFMASSGEQALSQCKTHMPDLVLLDVVMPGMNGHQVCTQLKEDALTSHIPIIFLTAQHDEADEVLGFELGAVDFIAKPINTVILSARVDTHMALKIQGDLLTKAVMVDGLTGIANRRKFDMDLQLNWLHCCRNKFALSLLMIDVDYFKRYNDFYGHQQGDKCLQQIAQCISQVVKRPYDLAARYGGEEFVCLLPNTDHRGAVQLADTILKQVRGLELAHSWSETAKIATVSIGLATITLSADTTRNQEELLLTADQALFVSKEAGRNRLTAIDMDNF